MAMSRSNDHHLNGADVKGREGGVTVASHRIGSGPTRALSLSARPTTEASR
jgi:hypothetical protein